jgi:hypothetical protein
MTNKVRLKRAVDPETLTMVFTQDLNNPDIFKCDDGAEYTRDEMNALKNTENQKIIKYHVIAGPGMRSHTGAGGT